MVAMRLTVYTSYVVLPRGVRVEQDGPELLLHMNENQRQRLRRILLVSAVGRALTPAEEETYKAAYVPEDR